MNSTLSLNSNRMSPFADKPELWLTSHLQRQKQEEQVVKIQAVVKGFLYRRRQQRLSLESIGQYIKDITKWLEPPKNPVSVPDFLRQHGLGTWADMCPSKEDALCSVEASDKRRECLWHAKNTLRLLGKAQLISELEWHDYHDTRRALDFLATGKKPEESLWSKLTKLVLG